MYLCPLQSRMMHNTVKGNTLPALREWLKTASNKGIFNFNVLDNLCFF